MVRWMDLAILLINCVVSWESFSSWCCLLRRTNYALLVAPWYVIVYFVPLYDFSSLCSKFTLRSVFLKVIEQYRLDGAGFVSAVLQDPLVLERLTGLDVLQKKTEELLSSMTIDESPECDESGDDIVIL